MKHIHSKFLNIFGIYWIYTVNIDNTNNDKIIYNDNTGNIGNNNGGPDNTGKSTSIRVGYVRLG